MRVARIQGYSTKDFEVILGEHNFQLLPGWRVIVFSGLQQILTRCIKQNNISNKKIGGCRLRQTGYYHQQDYLLKSFLKSFLPCNDNANDLQKIFGYFLSCVTWLLDQNVR